VPRRRYAVEILRVSVPSAASTLLTKPDVHHPDGPGRAIRTEATAGYGAAGRLEYLLIPFVFGVGSALVPLVAASDGAGDIGRVRALTRAGAALGAGGVWLVGGTIRPVSVGVGWGMFTSDPAVAGFGEAYLVRVGRPTPSSGWG